MRLTLERGERARLILRERLRRVEVERAQLRVAASASSTGRLNASVLPLAVPVVTIDVLAARAASHASAWCE